MKCKVCGDKHYCLGYCIRHYRKWIRIKDYLSGKTSKMFPPTIELIYDPCTIESGAYPKGARFSKGQFLQELYVMNFSIGTKFGINSAVLRIGTSYTLELVE